MLIKMAKSGQIRSQVTEQQLVGLLDQVSSVVPSASASKITVSENLAILSSVKESCSLTGSKLLTMKMILTCN